MKELPPHATSASSRLISWGHWLQTVLLTALLVLLLRWVDMLPPPEDTPDAAGVQRQTEMQQVSRVYSQHL